MFVSATGLLIFRETIVGWYTDDPEVFSIAISLLFVGAIFQVSDGIQVGAAGALRGLHDTRKPMLLTFVSYWVIGFPLSFVAAITLRLSPQMIWVGFVAGLTMAAVLLVALFQSVSKDHARLERVIARS